MPPGMHFCPSAMNVRSGAGTYRLSFAPWAELEIMTFGYTVQRTEYMLYRMGIPQYKTPPALV